jgi:tetratricopeptide (TPR) repeat protein
MGRPLKALEEWQAAWELDGTNPDYAAAVGLGMTGTRPRDALQYFERAEQLGADDAAFYNNYGQALQKAGERREASARFELAVEKDPDNEDYRFNLAASYTNMGAYRAAVEAWDELIGRYGPRWSYVVYRGRSYLGLARYDEAIQSVEAIVAAYESGELKQDGGRLDRTPPTLGEALEILAMSYRGAGNPSRGLEYIRRAVDLEPENVSYLNNYGVMLAESGSIDEARSLWKKVLEIDADNVAARRNLSAMEP